MATSLVDRPLPTDAPGVASPGRLRGRLAAACRRLVSRPEPEEVERERLLLLEEARALLERSLRDHDFAPAPIRHRNRPWARVARRLQKRLGAG